MVRVGSVASGVWLAGFLAGPLFIASAALAAAYLQLPSPIIIGPSILIGGLVMFVPAALFGSLIGLPVSAIGAAFMVALADHFEWARSPLVWMMVGAGLAIGVVLMISSMPVEIGFGIVSASAFSALLCRRPLAWVDDL
jgi:hypothetical protein